MHLNITSNQFCTNYGRNTYCQLYCTVSLSCDKDCGCQCPNLMRTLVQHIHGSTSLNLYHFKHQCFHKLTKMTLHFFKGQLFLKENNK